MIRSSRRRFLRSVTSLSVVAGSSVFFTVRGAFAEELQRTPPLTEGPFYPDKLPLDTDNDLLIINDNITPAVGEVTHLTGRILDTRGEPIRNATVEIWQCDANAVYLHSADSGRKPDQQDKNFQGFGRFTTGSAGEYRFRTIKPVPYPGRPAPHIHVKVKRGDRELLTTQINIDGHPGNDRDGIVRSLRDPDVRKRTMAEWKRLEDSRIGEWAARHDIIIGLTPDDDRPSTG